MPKTDEIVVMENEIKNALKAVCEKLNDRKYSDSEWTHNIKKNLAELGEKNNSLICTSGFGSNYNSEWLFDLVWYKEEGTGHNARLIDVPLVAECEWNMAFKHVRFDFEKLLTSNARLRLMICYSHPNEIDGLKVYFKEAINKYPLLQQGARFLVAILNSHTNEFMFEPYIKQW